MCFVYNVRMIRANFFLPEPLLASAARAGAKPISRCLSMSGARWPNIWRQNDPGLPLPGEVPERPAQQASARGFLRLELLQRPAKDALRFGRKWHTGST